MLRLLKQPIGDIRQENIQFPSEETYDETQIEPRQLQRQATGRRKAGAGQAADEKQQQQSETRVSPGKGVDGEERGSPGKPGNLYPAADNTQEYIFWNRTFLCTIG